MHFAFQYSTNGEVLAGFADAFGRGGGQIPIIVTEFLSSDDGERFLDRLDRISEVIFRRAPPGTATILESQINHVLAILHRDGRIEVWINEPAFTVSVKTKRSISVGDPVLYDDFADIQELRFKDVEIPDDTGYVVIFSAGWRKGLAFDFTPLAVPGSPPRKGLSQALGGLFSYLLFRKRFLLTTAEWDQLLLQKWFPFIGIPNAILDQMIQQIRAGWPVDDLLPKVVGAVRDSLPTIRGQIDASPLFGRHRQLLSDALSAYERREYALATAAIFPRIEGLLREYLAHRGPGKPDQEALANAPGTIEQNHRFSLLLPLRLAEYLKKVFFAFEDFSDPTKVVEVTRHAVAHGVAADALLDEKAATIGVLLLQQLGHLLPGT